MSHDEEFDRAIDRLAAQDTGVHFYEGSGPVGSHEVTIYQGLWTAGAEWGGWRWTAEGTTGHEAEGRLEARLAHGDPFHGADSGWGPPGRLAGSPDDLSDNL